MVRGRQSWGDVAWYVLTAVIFLTLVLVGSKACADELPGSAELLAPWPAAPCCEGWWDRRPTEEEWRAIGGRGVVWMTHDLATWDTTTQRELRRRLLEQRRLLEAERAVSGALERQVLLLEAAHEHDAQERARLVEDIQRAERLALQPRRRGAWVLGGVLLGVGLAELAE